MRFIFVLLLYPIYYNFDHDIYHINSCLLYHLFYEPYLAHFFIKNATNTKLCAYNRNEYITYTIEYYVGKHKGK